MRLPALLGGLLDALHGRSLRSAKPPIRFLFQPGRFFWAALITPVAGIGMLSLLMVADPYDIRPWGWNFAMGDISTYPVREIPKQIRLRTKQPYEVVLFGGSTTLQVTTRQLEQVFGTDRAINLSYTLPATQDTIKAVGRIAQTPGLGRLLISLNHSQMIGDANVFPPGQTAISILDARWYQAPDFSVDTVRATWHGLVTGHFSTADWQSTAADWDAGFRPLPEDRQLYRRLLRAHQSPLYAHDRPEPADCRRFPIVDGILPALRTAARRGALVDIFFPPIPYQTYALWERQPISGQAFRPGSRVDQIVDFHACIVRAVERERLPGVTVHAVDADEAIITNLTNYRDTVHLFAPEATERMLRSIAERSHVLTVSRLPEYRARLRAGVYPGSLAAAGDAAAAGRPASSRTSRQ